MVDVRGECGREGEADPAGIQMETGLPNKVLRDNKAKR